MEQKSNTVQAFWVAIGSFSNYAIALIGAAILSRYFEKAEYGTYKQILYVYSTLLIVFSAGLPRVFNYFLPRYPLEQGKVIVFKISRVLFLTGTLFSIFLFSFSGVIADVLKNPELARGLKYFSPVPMLLLPTLGIEGIFSTYKKTFFIAVYNTLTRSITLAFTVIPVILFSKSYITAIYGWIVSSVIIFVFTFYFKNIPFKAVKSEKSILDMKTILKYSMPLVTASIAFTTYRAANQFYISRFFGPEVFAEFSNGFMEIPFVHMITFSTSTVLMPVFSKIVYEKGDVSQITNLWNRTMQRSALIIYPMVIYFMFYSKELVTLVYSDVYSGSYKYFITAMIVNFFNIIIYQPLLLALGEVKFYARLQYWLVLITWIVEYLAVIIFKTPIAVAICFVIIASSVIVVSLGFSAKKLGVPFLSMFPAGKFIIIALHSFIALFIVNLALKYLIPDIHDLIYIIISGIIYIGILIISGKYLKIYYLDAVMPLLSRAKPGKKV